jgi:hypothetical protein
MSSVFKDTELVIDKSAVVSATAQHSVSLFAQSSMTLASL